MHNNTRTKLPLLLARAAGLLCALGVPAVAHAKKGPSPKAMVKAAKASPMYRKSMARKDLKKRRLHVVKVANGTRMNFLRYVKKSALDRRPEFAPLFDPKLPAGLLDGTPKYTEIIHELDDRLVVERRLNIPLAAGTCSKRKIPKAVRSLCFRRTGKGKEPQDVKQALAKVRAKIAKAPAGRITRGTVTAGVAAKMSDADLLGLVLDGDGRTVAHVSVVPRLRSDGSKPVNDFGKKLVPAAGQLPAKLPGSVSPGSNPGQSISGGKRDHDREYFLTGWTFGRQFSDTWEYTIAGSTWFTDRYFIRFQYLLGLGFGVRVPFSVDVTSSGKNVSSRDVKLSVDPVNVDAQGRPAYPAVGLPSNKFFGGKEFVLEFKANCSLYISIPGDNIDRKCPSIDKDYSRQIDPVLGSETSKIRDWWLKGKDVGLGLNLGVAGAYVDLGLGADITNGRIGMKVQALSKGTLAGVQNSHVSFSNRNPFSFKVSRASKTSDTGFRLSNPTYGFDIRLTPKVRATIEVDLWIYENDWTLGPWAIDQLSISQGFDLPHHAGTVKHHDYKVFTFIKPSKGKATPGQSLPPSAPRKPAKPKLPPAAGAKRHN